MTGQAEIYSCFKLTDAKKDPQKHNIVGGAQPTCVLKALVFSGVVRKFFIPQLY